MQAIQNDELENDEWVKRMKDVKSMDKKMKPFSVCNVPIKMKSSGKDVIITPAH